MKTIEIWKLIEKIESYNFEQEGGFLKNCIEWKQLKQLNTHTHKNSGILNDDSCAICGYDLRNSIHWFKVI